MADRMLLDCAVHGPRAWEGHVVCSHCGRTYQTDSEDAPSFAPSECACGRLLMPDGPQALLTVDPSPHTVRGKRLRAMRREFTARAICDFCFYQRPGGRRISHPEHK